MSLPFFSLFVCPFGVETLIWVVYNANVMFSLVYVINIPMG